MIKSTYQYINLDYLELMTDGDNDTKRIMLDILFEELPTEIDKMNKTLATKNSSALQQISHKMKSTLAFIGNDILTKANKEIESIAKGKGKFSKLPELLDTMNTYYPKAIEELKQEYKKLSKDG